jgi:hypothetical protein
MRSRIVLIVMACIVLVFSAASAEVRTYRQVKDVSLKEVGDVRQSEDKGDLFEFTYSVDMDKNTITRTSIRRLDEASPRQDSTVYLIKDKRNVPGSEAGRGGKVLIAVQKDGNEILELGNRFAFTMRTSPLSQVITGVYKRVYTHKGKGPWEKTPRDFD